MQKKLLKQTSQVNAKRMQQQQMMCNVRHNPKLHMAAADTTHEQAAHPSVHDAESILQTAYAFTRKHYC